MSISDIVDLLCCPHCQNPLSTAPAARTVRCGSGHTFDLARQGYLNLLGERQPLNADTGGMVAARDRFLRCGHYRPIAERLAALAATARPGCLLDAGCGSGYYAAAMLDAAPELRGLGVDVSVPACRRAASVHPRLAAVVADVWQRLPIRDAAVDLVSSVFAPRNAAEFSRVLRPGGLLVVVHPEPAHLEQLRRPLRLLAIEDAKGERLHRTLSAHFTWCSEQRIQFDTELDKAAVGDLVGMGPNAFHLDPAQLETLVGRLALPVTVTAAVTISAWQRRQP
ncbi:MAG TPA: methyltransferase domain-containing protein [Propionibacteriaceae bacterium]|nr:methyltransferase domain-containing protein [Propionibacteriaceae bacterium]